MSTLEKLFAPGQKVYELDDQDFAAFFEIACEEAQKRGLFPNIFVQVKQVLEDRRDGDRRDITDDELDDLDEDFVWDFIGRAISELQFAIVEQRT